MSHNYETMVTHVSNGKSHVWQSEPLSCKKTYYRRLTGIYSRTNGSYVKAK
jgi:hypothetical protein